MALYIPESVGTRLQAFQLRPEAEFRLRFERRIDRDLVESTNDNRTDGFFRTRAGVDARYAGWHGKLTYQLASDEAWTAKRNWMIERRDVVLAYAEHRYGPGMLTVGRQRIKVGTERLFGELNWSNVSIAHDAIQYRTQKWGAFAGRLAVGPRPRSTATFAGASVRHNRDEVLVAISHDSPNSPNEDRWLLDNVTRRTFGKLSVDLEGAVELRADAGQATSYAASGRVGYSVARSTSLYTSGNFATGDFDPLYGSAHNRSGLLDLQGLRNAQNLAIGIKTAAGHHADLSLEFRSLALEDGRKPWFNSAAGAVRKGSGIYQDATGRSGRNLGDEIDADYRWNTGAPLSGGTGLGWFRPGRFVRSLGGRDSQTFGYVELTYRF